MTKIFIDAGTSWSKVLEISESGCDFAQSALNSIENLEGYKINNYNLPPIFNTELRIFLFPSNFFAVQKIDFDGATGHMAKNRIKENGFYQNEMLSLAYGAKKFLSEEELENATIIDIGSRDLKWVRFTEGKYRELDWNGSCGSVTGATVEMLTKFYGVDVSKISLQKEKIPVTCGVFAMEKIMDDIASNVAPETAIAKYINGIAHNTWKFAGCPDKVYLSGGFCLNNCFIESLKYYCEVKPLGRLVLLNGLY